MLFVTVIIALYLMVLIANLGGYVDQIFKGVAYESAGGLLREMLKDVTDPAERARITDEVVWQMEEAYGLHRPFLQRSLVWLYNGMTLGLGEARDTTQRSINSVRGIRPLILERLPYTLSLFGSANLFLFFSSLFLALSLSRKQGSWMDRLNIILSSLTSAPSWIYGVFLIIIFAGTLRIFPYPQRIELRNVDLSVQTLLFLSSHMALPFASIVLSTFFQSIYAWRTFFLIHSEEEYVDLARAKGLPAAVVDRNYILKPALPYVLTSFALMVVSLWQGSIALEVLFQWPGIGVLFLGGVRTFQTSLIIGIVVIFAYLLAITVFILDIAYALVDPRVSLGNRERAREQPASHARKKSLYRVFSDLFNRRRRAPASHLASHAASPAASHHSPEHSARTRFSTWARSLWKGITGSKPVLSELLGSRETVFALLIIAALAAISIYAVIAIPYEQVVRIWRGQGDEQYRGLWYENPKYALPAWVNFFRRDKLPETIILNSRDGTGTKTVQAITDEMTEVSILFPFAFPYDEFPQELILYLQSSYVEKKPLIVLTWLTPDGREIELSNFSITSSEAYYLFRDEKLQRKLKGQPIVEALFTNPAEMDPDLMQGDYALRVSGFVFEEGSDLDAELVLHGQVSGLAGTDHNRRDLILALLWGAPLALAFGLFGAIGTNLIAMTLAALGVWVSGWVDDLLQRITEVNMILPVLPIAIMVYILYSKSIWVILGVVVLLSIFGSTIKNYRAAFLQVKNAVYIEAALAYGASPWRIIRHYLVPRILPVLIPQMVIMVPTYVYYEATLAYLGVSDPYLPTWGKVIYDAIHSGGLGLGHYYLVLEPLALMLLSGLAFAMLGLALDRVLNPKLSLG